MKKLTLTLVFFTYALFVFSQQPYQEWVAKYNYSGQIEVADILVDLFDNVYVTGWLVTASTGSDYITIKYNRDGVEQWVAIYDGPASSTDKATGIFVNGWTGGCLCNRREYWE